jgi:hypothetical protein
MGLGAFKIRWWAPLTFVVGAIASAWRALTMKPKRCSACGGKEGECQGCHDGEWAMTQPKEASMMTTSYAESEDDQYKRFEKWVRDQFILHTSNNGPLFTTNAPALFDVFLSGLPQERRQHYTCHACRRFIDRFGGLVQITKDGATLSPFWLFLQGEEPPPAFFATSVALLARVVVQSSVTGVFLSSETVWGLPENTTPKPPGVWRHLHVEPSSAQVFPVGLLTAGQRAAERLEGHHMLCRGLAEFPLELVEQAHQLLTSGNLYRSEKCIGVAKWLLDLHRARAAAVRRGTLDNVTWLAVATAPAGFCHVRSGMIGTLLEDIQAGLAFADIKAKFDAKMHTLLYQRPQAAPSAGNVAQAEKIVGELASAGALARRFARLEDIETIWRPRVAEPIAPKGGVFGHLKTKGNAAAPAPLVQPPVTMTWEKFARTVLPDAERMEFLVTASAAPFAALVTAASMDAPPIIQWDRPEKRNPVTWYLYNGGSPPSSWGLEVGWCDVSAIALQPSMWAGEEKSAHQGASVFLILSGAKDTRRKAGSQKCGGGFFPEHLRSEYHAVRATMEAYSNAAEIAGWEEVTACGLKVEKGSARAWNYVVRVTSKGGAQLSYNLDRWD